MDLRLRSHALFNGALAWRIAEGYMFRDELNTIKTHGGCGGTSPPAKSSTQ